MSSSANPVTASAKVMVMSNDPVTALAHLIRAAEADVPGHRPGPLGPARQLDVTDLGLEAHVEQVHPDRVDADIPQQPQVPRKSRRVA